MLECLNAIADLKPPSSRLGVTFGFRGLCFRFQVNLGLTYSLSGVSKAGMVLTAS